MIRVLIVDDSPTARELLAGIMNSDPELTIVGEARDGAEAVRLIAELRPDVVTMDVHMPVLDGFESTKRIMIESPTPIVIVSSSTVVAEVATGMRALRAGALTLVRKPRGPDSPDYAAAARELIDTVKAMADVKVVRHHGGASVPEPPRTSASARAMSPARSEPAAPATRVAARSPRGAVAIAASTGGPPAVQHVFSGLPVDFSLPILVVQHMAKGFTAGYAEWLNSTVELRVKVAAQGDLLETGTVYIASENQHLELRNDQMISVSESVEGERFCPSANCLFSSVAKVFREASLAVIMTGMGDDGVDGLREIKRCGGWVIAQDRETSVVHGMPGAAVEAGVVDEILPLDQIASAIQRFALRLQRT